MTEANQDAVENLVQRLRWWQGDGHPHGLLHREAADTLEALSRRATPPPMDAADGEAAARDWLDSKFLNVEAGHDPNDRAYDADEMVDAFMAGAAATPPDHRGIVQIGQDVEADEAVKSALYGNLRIEPVPNRMYDWRISAESIDDATSAVLAALRPVSNAP